MGASSLQTGAVDVPQFPKVKRVHAHPWDVSGYGCAARGGEVHRLLQSKHTETFLTSLWSHLAEDRGPATPPFQAALCF